MAILSVGPNSSYSSIANAMLNAGAGDTIQLQAGYGSETATVTHNGMTITGSATSIGIVLQLGTGIATVFLAGTAPINVLDASDANGITGNSGNNVITVTGGADAVNGGAGVDRLIVDYHLATGAVTGNSTSNFSEAGGGARTVTITNGTFENFTVLTGSGADTLTVGDGTNVVKAGNGANTITAGQGANNITGGSGADTITAGNGGNSIDAGNGANNITSGAGADVILSGTGTDTIVAGGGNDLITIRGGSDTVGGGAGIDRLIVDYSALTTAVIGGITTGSMLSGYSGHIADTTTNLVNFTATENFTITTGKGADNILTGDGDDILRGGAGNDTLTGGAGNDTIDGGADTDYLYGQGGNDTLIGGAAGSVGANQLWGGTGTDTASYVGTAGAVRADLGALAGYVDGLLVDQMNAIENLIGGSGSDTLVGDAGANMLAGHAGTDYLYGQGGDDTLIGGAAASGGANQLWGGTGTDTASYAGTTGTVHANLAAQAGYVGGVLADQMNSVENLIGGSNADTLVGNGGANRLTGGGGGDALWGGGGADVFAYLSYSDSNLVTGYDTIAGFSSGTSKLDLTALDTDAAHVFIQSSAQSTSLYVEKTPGVFNASTDLAISLVGANAIAVGDILF